MHSQVYVGQVKHRRLKPTPHAFDYGLFMLYIDLQELPTLFDRFWLWSARGFNLAWFKREDHMGDPKVSLETALKDHVEDELGRRPAGAVRLLTHLRYFGYCMNPVSFYYCFNAKGDQIEAVVAEVNNTPWGEQHVYVLDALNAASAANPSSPPRPMQFALKKDFRVSPFMPMDIDYEWRVSRPEQQLMVHIENFRHQEKIFDATLMLERRALNGATLARCLVKFPLMSFKVVATIYLEAFKLWIKKTPLFLHTKH